MEDIQGKKKILTRLKRAQGQVGAIHRMLEEDSPCLDLLVQIAAVQGALNKAGQDLLNDHIENCVHEVFENGDTHARAEKMQNLMTIFQRYTHIGGPS